MKKKISFEDVKEFFADLSENSGRKIQIEQIVINEIIFTSQKKEASQNGLFYETISSMGTLATWTAIAAVSYALFFNS